MIRSAVPSLLLLSFLAACGASPTGAASASSSPVLNANAASSEANVAAKASEPRSADPTAARSTEAPPPSSPFASLGMTGAPPPASPKKASADAPKRISARHVLIQWMGAEHAPDAVVRSREQALVVATEVLRRARAKEDFARLAVEYSDEPNAGARGGSLGRFGHGQMVPQFEAAAFQLDVGEISGIVESPFGFHVIQRTE